MVVDTKKAGRERLVLTVEEAGALLSLGRSASYDAVRRGDIPTIRIGKRILVPRKALEQMLEGYDGQERDSSGLVKTNAALG